MSRSDADRVADAKAHLARLRQHLERGDMNDETHGYIYADKAVITATVEHDLADFEVSLDRLAAAAAG